MNQPIEFFGAPASPYSRKMLSYLRYRNLPYRFLLRSDPSLQQRPVPKGPALLPTFFFMQDGKEVAVTDSTPIIRKFEQEYSDRTTLPSGGLCLFVNDLLEDYADEWLTKAMFHYRWSFQDDIDLAALTLPQWNLQPLNQQDLDKYKQYIAKRQIERLPFVGSHQGTALTIEQSFQRFLLAFDQLLSERHFVLGKPSPCDFALYGQLTQLVSFDHTSAALTKETTSRVFAWVMLMEDLSGFPASDNFSLPSTESGKQALGALLDEVVNTHLTLLEANEKAIEASQSTLHAEVLGASWSQGVFPYHLRCLKQLRISYAQLNSQDLAQLQAIVSEQGYARLKQVLQS